MNRLKKNIIALSVLQGANYVFPLIIIPYLVRVLGAENFGRIAFAQALITYFMVLTDYGFNLSATQAVTQTRDDKEALSRLASAVMLVKIFIMSGGFLLLLGVVLAVPAWRADWPLFAVVYLMVVGNVAFPIWLFQGLERMRHITIFNISARVLVVIAIFTWVHNPADYVLAAAIQASTMLIAGIIAQLALPHIVSINWRWPGAQEIRRVVGDGWHVFLASFAGNVANSSNTFFLGLVATPAVVGYFAAAEKLIRAVQSLIFPISQAVYPHVTQLLKSSQEKAISFIAKLTKVLAAGGVAAFLGLFVLANEITSLLYGHGFQQTAELIRLLSIIPLLVALNSILGAQVLVQFRMGKLLSSSTVTPTIIHLAMLYFVATRYGAVGVAALMIFTESLILIVRTVGLAFQRPEVLKRITFG